MQSLLKGKIPLLVALGLGLLAGVVAFSAIKKREADARRGWNLVSVVVADQDIREGSTITGEMISSRPVPEQFVTSSVVKPDAVSYVLNQKVLVPIQAGDMLLWTQFETLKSERLSSRIQRERRGDIAAKRRRAGHRKDDRDHQSEPRPRKPARLLECYLAAHS